MTARGLPYASFARHLDKPEPEAAKAPPPLSPEERVVKNAIELLEQSEAALALMQREVLAHLPQKVRLALSKVLLTTADKATIAYNTFLTYQAYGTLKPPRSAKPKAAQPRAKVE